MKETDRFATDDITWCMAEWERIAPDSRDTSEIRAYHTVFRTSARSAWLT